ncbi:hypothetical protein [Sphingobacterium bovistauri]|uniref:Ribbon-helix-helix domain-containing protein n=1 Tax=Sphingobacterium bovistauri TaxID=2781959 RepID=A0ABS7Z383_9SPHI|nr:hypothetical protein [Sphingobacterium bovistauri]MCA5004052.1 hypothetical protein [Sphingobacterium bovistauri]
MRNNHHLNTIDKKETKRRYYLSLTESELYKFTELTKSLGMSKSKIVKLMVIENSNVMLYNTVELIKTLDLLGNQIAQIRNTLEPEFPFYFAKSVHRPTDHHSYNVVIKSIDEYFQTLCNIEDSFRELLKITKKMK